MRCSPIHAAGWLNRLAAVTFLALAGPAAAQTVPHPAEVWGFEPGADYHLADYTQVHEYFTRLAESSPRVHLEEIGRTVEDRPMVLAFISSEANLRQLERWRSTAARLARARDLDEAEARRLAKEGRAIVWIDGGLHSTEVAHSQHTSELAYRVATEETPEMRRIREEVVLLLMPVMNPDGLDIVVDWYRSNVGTEHETAALPWLYHRYMGHDNNRDWFMITQPETEAVSRVLYHEWYPQIVYNHHQVAPFPARIFVPPFADPVNPHIPPGVVRGVNLVGEAMASRFAREGKPGVVSRMTFTMWWNGGMRTAPYFHNMIGILTETALYRYATPHCYEAEALPAEFGRGSHRIPTMEPTIFHADPWPGGCWHLADAMDYMMTASLAVMDIGARMREDWLYGMYHLGRDALERGAAGGPHAYVVPPDQHDVWEAIELVNVLRRGGVEVEWATRDFEADGERFPAGSYIVRTAQAFRPYVMDLMEPQAHPNRELYPGGPPEPPYGGLAGWTLPIQMGVEVARIETPFIAESEPVGVAAPARGTVAGAGRYGFILEPRSNAAAIALNRLLAAGERVSRLDGEVSVAGRTLSAGSLLVESGDGTRDRVEALARELGVDFVEVDRAPSEQRHALRTPRVALYKSWVANIDEGWTRWVLERYGFAPDTLFDRDIRGGALAGYDVLVLPDQAPARMLGGHRKGAMPVEYTGGLGEEGAAAIARFVEEGGTVLALDAASDFVIEQLGLPLRNAVAEIPRAEFYVPGSLLRLELDPTHPVAYGLPPEAAAFYAGSRAFEAHGPDPGGRVEVVARYGQGELLLSGWENGAEAHLAGRPAVVRVHVGSGNVVLIGFRPQFRGQPRGTFKLLFNAIHDSVLERRPDHVAAARPAREVAAPSTTDPATAARETTPPEVATDGFTAAGIYDLTLQVMGDIVPIELRIEGSAGRYRARFRVRAGGGEVLTARTVEVDGQQVTVIADTPAGDMTVRFTLEGDDYQGMWSVIGETGAMEGERRALPGA